MGGGGFGEALRVHSSSADPSYHTNPKVVRGVCLSCIITLREAPRTKYHSTRREAPRTKYHSTRRGTPRTKYHSTLRGGPRTKYHFTLRGAPRTKYHFGVAPAIADFFRV